MADTNAFRPTGGDIHRLLDEAFAGIEMTPEVQDLKEEVRANLTARVADLEAAGTSSADAARSAISELGDVRDLLGDSEAGADAPRRAATAQDAFARHRVRPKPAFVVRVVLWSALVVVGLTLALLGATGVLPFLLGVQLAFLGVASTGLWFLVGDSLSQETTTNHPMPQPRAAAYGIASWLALYGVGSAGLIVLGSLPVWGVVFAALGIVASVVLFAFLGATQTNRHKAWVVRHTHEQNIGNRFEEEPETAARFGIYTAVIWTVAFAAFVVLTFTVGWAWSWLALLGGFVIMLLTLARMLFGPRQN